MRTETLTLPRLSSVRSADTSRESNSNLGMSQVELRYNLATKVMRNGVEVIVATDRNLRPVEPEYLRLLSSTVTRPITLAPHTLTNLMSMVLFTEQVADGQSHLMSILQPSFVTKTLHTTFIYPMTVLTNGSSTVTKVQTVIANTKTEQYSNSPENVQPTTVTLDASPTLQTEVFHTAYTYLNTFLDGDQPLVMSSTQTLSNTLTVNFGSPNELEPSEVYPTTNTYHKTVEIARTLTDGTDFQIVSTKDIVTQLVVTDKPEKKSTNVPLTTEVTKTYFVTYTYFSTYTDGDQTKVKSDVSVSSDVTIEKFYIKPKKTETKMESTKAEFPMGSSPGIFPFTILAAKPYRTTFTYFTTLLQGPNSDKAKTKIISRTKVVENTITETISPQDFKIDYLTRLNSSLNKITGSVVTTATLKRGEKIVITAYKTPSVIGSYQKYDIKPTKTHAITETKSEETKEPSKVKSTTSKSSSVHFKSKSTALSKSKIKPTKTLINEATAEALIGVEPESSSVYVTPTVILTPANSVTQKNRPFGNSESVYPTPSPTPTLNSQATTPPSGEPDTKKKPVVKHPTAPMNVSNLLSLNSLGINGMNVLGPVFNAMAELIHNNLNKNSDSMTRRNDTVPETEQQNTKKPSSNLNPLLSFVNKFTPAAKDAAEPKVKVTTPRTPFYIPVGSFAKDSEFGESQDDVVVKKPEAWHEKWTDAHAKNFEKGRPHEPPVTILEGGIPISPGQVITTNSDVIIGRPGESGPRPPTFAVKNNVPIDMKPPPLPPHVVIDGEEEDGFVGQHSTNQGIDSDFSKEEYNAIPPRPHQSPTKIGPIDVHKQIRPNLGDRFKSSPHRKNPHPGKYTQLHYDSGIVDLNPPPMPPPIRTHDIHRPITINHPQNDDVPYNPPNGYQIPLHLGPNQNVANYINPAEIGPAAVTPNIPFIQENLPAILNEPTPTLDINPNGILLIPTIAHVPFNLPPSQNSVDRSTGHQLLVNIQPSQVANIVIPHGSSTALILTDDKQHSLKGEVIDDPSPHPEPETVGFVGAEPVLKIESDDVVPTLHNVITPGTEQKQTAQDNRGLISNSNRPLFTTEHIKIRPKPAFNDVKVGQHQSFVENHRKPENNFRGEGNVQLSQNFESQKILKGSEALHFPGGNTKPIFFTQNYRKEGPNKVAANYFHHEKVPSGAQHVGLIKTHHKVHAHATSEGSDQKKFIRGPNLVKGESGIYVDISPPGHLPPSQMNHPLQGLSPIKHQSASSEHLSNHQSGHVHDVPLNAQVQLGSGQKKENPLKEILISANTNKHDSVHDPDNVRRPLPEIPENLSPPPLPKEGHHRPVRPLPFKPHATPAQRYPPLPHPGIPKPAEFMIPPPQISHRPNQKLHPDLPRPAIPIGAGAPQQNYPNPRPEDILIVPPKNRPVTKFDNQANIYSDLDVSDTSDPIKTEYGEEIQESISRPLFPGQLPVELQETAHDIPSNHKIIDKPKPSTTQATKPKEDNKPPKVSGEANKQTSNFFSLIKKPSSFVTNKAEVTLGHKEPANYPNHKEQVIFDPFKVPAGSVVSAGKPSAKLPIHAVGPSVIPSGFVHNENAVDRKKSANNSNGELETEEIAREPVKYNKVAKNKTQTDGFIASEKKTIDKEKPTNSESKERPKPLQEEGPKFSGGFESEGVYGTVQPAGVGQSIQESIKFDSNKISIGRPSIANVGLYGSNKPGVKPSKRPSGFTNTKENQSKGPASSATDAKPSGAKDVIHSKVPSGFTIKNDTDHFFGTQSNHNYGNKTLYFYETKPTFDVNEERDVTYNKPESDADKWFASNFGGSNADSDVKITQPNKSTHRNVSAVVSAPGSDVQITLLTPPKVEDVKSQDVMGLSPPPLERPRRPPKPQRPKPPYKFEIPTTPNSAIAIENDFPPVRSPEFNRKPLKPQDIFPPRLPDNFIHHLPDYPVRNHPKPRPERPSTSMPIDVPENVDGEKKIFHEDFEELGGRDTFFAGSEINGHSKPIFDNESILGAMRPPPPPASTITRPKLTLKPTTIHQQQPPKISTTETTGKPKSTATTDELSPTSTIKASKTAFQTKTSASVTPTSPRSPIEWEEPDIITGSETIFDPDLFSTRTTPTIQDATSKRNIITTLISTGSTTIFGDLFTAGAKHKPEGSKNAEETGRIEQSKTAIPKYTTTLTVTTTMTTVVHSVGRKPSTKTIVLTKTLISTVFNKVTETKTLVKPTTATIIQTHTIATTKTALVVSTALYPTQTKHSVEGTLKSEIFMADPHDKDTMTISVSSSMNKHKTGEEKRPMGTRPSDKDVVVLVSNKQPDKVISGDDEITDSRVVVGGVFDANDEKEYKEGGGKEVECSPKCKARRNELCQRVEGAMKCVCRPGFARMFPDRPCRPTYTYNVQLTLDKLDPGQITEEKNFAQSVSPNMAKLASATKEGLDRMIMQSDLRDIYHGVMLNGFQGKDKKTMVDFYVQLSENTDETKLTNILKKTLRTSNYSLGGTELFAARESGSLRAEDFNECLSPKFHDCSENARCFNLKGTYTCSCKEGFTDLSENSQFPGRVCSDTIGCEYCGYHGACYSKGEGQITCQCFQWYSGERCHINLKVLLIALVTIGAILLALLLVCSVLTCLNRRTKHASTSRTNGSSAGYLRYRGPSSQSLDRRAMIGDSSSESSVDNLPYVCSPPVSAAETVSGKKKPVLRRAKGPAPRPVPPPGMEQRDRSVTVMIPRAKYRPVPPLSPYLTMSTFSPDKHLSKTAAQIATEQKLINYLDGNTRETHGGTNARQAKEQQKSSDYKTPSSNDSLRPAEKKKEPKVFEYEYKISNMLFTEETTNSVDKKSFKSLDDRFRRHSDSTHLYSENSNRNQFRKYSAGALVSAGYEVSAKVGMHHLEEYTAEDEHSGIVNAHTMKSNRSQFTTLNRTGDHKTMSEARSYDETTVHPQTRSLKTHYSGSSPSSRVNNDEGHTMIERDLGSTFIMPESQLFKPEADRGSDISNFDSL